MKMRIQRRIGLAMVAVSWLLLLMAMTGRSPADQDVTAVLFTLPLGLYLLFSGEYILYP